MSITWITVQHILLQKYSFHATRIFVVFQYLGNITNMPFKLCCCEEGISNFSKIKLPDNYANILPTKDGKSKPPICEVATKSFLV